MAIWGGISVLTGLWHSIPSPPLTPCFIIGFTTKSVAVLRPIQIDISVPFSFFGAFLTRFFLGFVEASFFPGALVRQVSGNTSTKFDFFSF
jgi:hypothetical protein